MLARIRLVGSIASTSLPCGPCAGFLNRSCVVLFRSFGTILSPGIQFVGMRNFSSEDVDEFCRITCDPNPIHSEASLHETANAGFSRPIVPGMFVASLFPSMIATHFPGALYLRQTLAFKAPVEVRATAKAKA